MALKSLYQSQEEIPDGLSDHYKEQADGSYKISLENGVKTQADVDRAFGAMEKQKELRIDAERKLSKIPDDFDAERWDEVKDIDPEKYFSGELDEDAEKEIQKRVSAQVREKEKEIKKENKQKYENDKAELDKEKESTRKELKDMRFRQDLANAGFTNPAMLDDLMLQLKYGNNKAWDDLRTLYNSVDVNKKENGNYKYTGGDLKDEQGYKDVIDNFTHNEKAKEKMPASNNTGGGASNNGDTGSVKNNPFKQNTEHYNVSEQSQIIINNPSRAKKLAKAAGWSEQELEQIKD